MLRWVEQQIDQLVDEAKGIAEGFWAQHHDSRRTRPKDEWSRIGVRARRHHGNLSVEWFRIEWRGPVGKGRSAFRTQHLRKGHGKYRYSMKAFANHARDWELPLVQACEERFEQLRRKAAELARIRKAVTVLAVLDVEDSC